VSNVVIKVGQRARGNVTAAMILWSLAMSVVIFLLETHWTSTSSATWAGVGATVLFGLYLGWQRRIAAVLVAPLVSWFFAWPLLWIAAMVRDGFVKGLFVGLFLITIGWIAIGFTEFVGLGVVAFVTRWLRGGRRASPDVVVFGPSE